MKVTFIVAGMPFMVTGMRGLLLPLVSYDHQCITTVSQYQHCRAPASLRFFQALEGVENTESVQGAVEELFDVISCYFPISFVPVSANDPRKSMCAHFSAARAPEDPPSLLRKGSLSV